MFTQTSEYALRAVAWLAAHPKGVHTAGEIAEGTGVRSSYLSKVLQSLARKGIVRSQRGLGGGFTLQRSPSDLTVLDVMGAVDPLPRIECCPLGIHEHQNGLCRLHYRLDMTMQLVEDCLKSATIESLYSGDACTSPFGLPMATGEKEEVDEG
jgi:Rrf2 family transcriptional regulator, nitric oxide-sensitive transcriptional repressor